MELSGFAESNGVLAKPPGMTDEECTCAQVWRGPQQDGLPVVLTCWKPTQAEIEEIQRTGRVWLHIVGQTMPPAYVGGFSPFPGLAGDSP